MSARGRIFDLSKGCTHDGPGLRTVVFLKGCALACPWCHNPEGISMGPELAFDGARCLRCGRCVEACPRNPGAWSLDGSSRWREGCLACGRCAEVCPSGTRRLVGRELSVEELVEEVRVDEDFFTGTGGGVTFSGGEPLLQAEFLFACAARLAELGIHVAVETAGLFSRRLVEGLARDVNLVLFDLKHVDPERLSSKLGVDGRAILANLSALLATEVALELRVTLVPGFNASADDLRAMARWIRAQPRVPVVVLQGFHRLAAGKSGLCGGAYRYAEVAPLSARELADAARLLAGEGLPISEEG